MLFSKKEFWTAIIPVLIVFEFLVYFWPIILSRINPDNFKLAQINPLILIVPIIIIFANVIVKKLMAKRYSIKIEHDIWKLQRYAWYDRSHFKKPFPMGIAIPFGISFFTLALVNPLTFMQFDYKNDPYQRIQRKEGRIRRSEINDSDPAFTAAWGFVVLAAVSLIGTLINFKELAILPVTYSLWNMIPFSNLDGLKLFVGRFFIWLVILVLLVAVLALALFFTSSSL